MESICGYFEDIPSEQPEHPEIGRREPKWTQARRIAATIDAEPVWVTMRRSMTNMDDQIAKHVMSMILRIDQSAAQDRKQPGEGASMLESAVRLLRSEPAVSESLRRLSDTKGPPAAPGIFETTRTTKSMLTRHAEKY